MKEEIQLNTERKILWEKKNKRKHCAKKEEVSLLRWKRRKKKAETKREMEITERKKGSLKKKWNSPFEQNGILLATQWEWDYWQEAGKIKHEGILITCS